MAGESEESLACGQDLKAPGRGDNQRSHGILRRSSKKDWRKTESDIPWGDVLTAVKGEDYKGFLATAASEWK